MGIKTGLRSKSEKTNVKTKYGDANEIQEYRDIGI